MMQKFAGHDIRQARQLIGLTQRALAAKLDISAAYLNQIESNQRPLSAAVGERLRQKLGLDLNSSPDPLVEHWIAQGLPADARMRAAQALQICPEIGDWLQRQMLPAAVPHSEDAYAEIGDWFYLQDNHIESLDRAAEGVFRDAGFRITELDRDLEAYLRRFGVQVDLVDDPALARGYDSTAKRVQLGRWLTPAQRAFQLAQQLLWLQFSDRVEDIVKAANLTSPAADPVLRIGLANYFAGALVMPYQDFLQAARDERYDLERLQRLFQCSFESVCHRLSTLQRPGNKGIPFYFVRVDAAGQIMKRQSPAGFHFARQGGACPLWNVHEALSRPDQILVQRVRTPDERQLLCLAQAVIKPGPRHGDPARRFAVGIGCELRFAPDIVYADGLDLTGVSGVTDIGPGCRHCLRPNCAQRAFAPLGKAVHADIHQRARVPLRWG
ncbi:helix-turn-helix domain-containing protein [Litorivicinus lipolyticus]|nr:helix-turn-helix transcriptional regulator [Litorivicinus lipolyticus]